jgi:hypothetical protein
MAVSLYHQGDNLDRARMRELTGQPEPPGPPGPPAARPPLREWLRQWIARDADPRQEMDSLPGVMWHLRDAWARRGAPNVVLVHYDSLGTDLEGEMRRLARLFGIAVPEPAWPALVAAATFDRMRANADHLVPSAVLKSNAAFFRRGTSGSAREVLTGDEFARYHARAERLAPRDMLAWLHSGGAHR